MEDISCRELLLRDHLKEEGITDCPSLVEYDFSNYNTSEKYKNMKGFDKFFAYILRFYKPSDNLQYAYKKCSDLKKNNVFHGISDPDSNCILLREIYSYLWDTEYLNYCTTDNNEIRGDTMNSVNTTLNELIKNYTHKRTSKLSNADIYYSPYSNLKKYLNENENILNFINTYHTLGNFIPFPADCNSPRGTGITRDYWDLTLNYIYIYYLCKESDNEKEAKKSVINICGQEKVEIFTEWLDKFGSWNIFVNKNYMSAFIKDNGEPKELWEGHFNGKVLPDAEQCNQYFKNANEWIEKRSITMAKKVFNKIYKDNGEY